MQGDGRRLPPSACKAQRALLPAGSPWGPGEAEPLGALGAHRPRLQTALLRTCTLLPRSGRGRRETGQGGACVMVTVPSRTGDLNDAAALAQGGRLGVRGSWRQPAGAASHRR